MSTPILIGIQGGYKHNINVAAAAAQDIDSNSGGLCPYGQAPACALPPAPPLALASTSCGGPGGYDPGVSQQLNIIQQTMLPGYVTASREQENQDTKAKIKKAALIAGGIGAVVLGFVAHKKNIVGKAGGKLLDSTALWTKVDAKEGKQIAKNILGFDNIRSNAFDKAFNNAKSAGKSVKKATKIANKQANQAVARTGRNVRRAAAVPAGLFGGAVIYEGTKFAGNMTHNTFRSFVPYNPPAPGQDPSNPYQMN